jgi:Mrp family chromosome partitioning ATPase/capsular polysaccharide biosynthesis protein
MDLLAYFRVLRRRWLLILALVLAGGTIGAASTLLSRATGSTGKHFKATHTLVFQESGNENGGDSSARPAITNLDQVAVLVTTGDVPTKAGQKLGLAPYQVSERITTETNGDSGTLAITGIAFDAKDAEKLSDTVAQQTIDTLNEKEQSRFDRVSRQTVGRLDKLRSDIADLDQQLAAPGASDLSRAERDGLVDQYRLAFERFQQLATDGAPTGGLSTLETAASVPISEGAYDTLRDRAQAGENNTRIDAQQNPVDDTGGSSTSTPSFDTPTSRGILGAFIGLLLGVGLALVTERFDRRLRTRDDVGAAFELPVLAEVPRLSGKEVREKEVVVQTAPISRAAEAYRAVRSSLMFQNTHLDGSGADRGSSGNGAGSGSSATAKPEGLVVMIASPVPGDGKTTTTANLAAAFAETGSSVLVVNCDFRRPMAHAYLRAADKPRRTLRTAIPGVWFVSRAVSEPDANPARVIAAQKAVVAAARDHFDVIVLDTAPLLTANDAVEVAESADLVLLVARFQSTTSDNAQRSIELLQRVEAPVAGVVVIGTPEDAGAYYYYEYRTGGRRASGAAEEHQEDAERDDLQYDADAEAMNDEIFAGSSGEPESSG